MTETTTPRPAMRHATTVAIDGAGVMIEGASGSGKSDLALRLIDRGAVLVSDDVTMLTTRDGTLIAAPPATIAGQIEVRGLGIVSLPHMADMPVALLVTIGAEARMPEPAKCAIEGIMIRHVTIDPLAPSAPIKVELALRGGVA